MILRLARSLPEHISSVIAAHKGNMNLAINLAIGSSNQVLGFVLPIIQFVASKYPKTFFLMSFPPYIAWPLFINSIVTCIVLTSGMIYKINVFHGSLSLTMFAILVMLTFSYGGLIGEFNTDYKGSANQQAQV